jgi:hypothetical protein
MFAMSKRLSVSSKHVKRKIVLASKKDCPMLGGAMNEIKTIQSLGGIARAESLSPEQRAAQAAKAANARWAATRQLKGTHKGNFKKDFGIDVDCYVLDDATKTAVISQRGMGSALGFSAGGNRFHRFMATEAMVAVAGAEITDKITQPIKFQWGIGGAEQPPTIVHGYDVTLLIDVCRAIVEAAPRLSKRQAGAVSQAHVILNASAKAGIKGLVYALAGYRPETQEVIDAFKVYVQEEAKKYEKEFPPELYAEWHRLYQIPVLPVGRSWHFKHLTLRDIYWPLAKSNGKILQLARANKAQAGERSKKLFQFLSEIGTRALRMHLGRVLEMAEDSTLESDYEKKVRRRFGGQDEFDF